MKVLGDHRKDIALLLLLLAAAGIWSSFQSVSTKGPGWLELGVAAMFVAIGVGLWRAFEWARWACGWMACLVSLRCLFGIVELVQLDQDQKASLEIVVCVCLLGFAVFWAAIAFICLRPATGQLFARIRASQGHGGRG